MAEQQAETNDDKRTYIRTLEENLRYSISKFDSQTLAISGGALGISLSFIKDIVPLESSISTWLLYAAQFLFTFAITLGFVSHYWSQKGTSNAIEKAESDRFSDIPNDNLRTNLVINTCNYVIVWIIPLAIFSLVLFCLINIENSRSANDSTSKKPTPRVTIHKNTGSDTGITIEAELKSLSISDTAEVSTSIIIK